MATKNYKSDFNFILRLYSVLTDSSGKEKERTELPWPDYDWSAKFWTSSKANAYYASCIGGVCTNCRNTDGKIQIVVDNHNMGLGILQVEFRAELPREIYPDGSERNVVPGVLDIELVRGAGDFPSDFEAQLQMPYIKLKYEDLTEEEKAEFQRPVTDATESLQEFQTTAVAAEVKREANEKTRVSAEQTRVTKESERQTAETTRQNQEALRVESETDREAAETSRVSAEEKRAEEFASWETEIDSKADRSELSNVIAEKSDDGAILKERSTGEVMYPHTLASLVQTSTGENVEEVARGAKYVLFDDQWTAAGGTVIVSGQTYGLNGLNDITYEQAIPILEVAFLSYIEIGSDSMKNRFRFWPFRNPKLACRTYFPINMYSVNASVGSAENMFQGWVNKSLEVLVFSCQGPQDWTKFYFSKANGMFSNNLSLHTIKGLSLKGISKASDCTNIFNNCLALETLELLNLRCDISLKDCSKLSLASIAYMIEHAANTSPITITVHADVYAKLTGDTTNEAAAALTPEELVQWQQVLADAVAKNISFATT